MTKRIQLLIALSRYTVFKIYFLLDGLLLLIFGVSFMLKQSCVSCNTNIWLTKRCVDDVVAAYDQARREMWHEQS